MNEIQRSVLVTITGRVQGVWFRDWTQRKALALGLAGWVRNRRDGRVEALFCGPVDDVEAMIGKCQSGSPLSRVDEIQTSEYKIYDGQGFEVRETG